ncbi:hypothetical protein EJ377_00985 [Chryseobacterium arthrosphaerae]|uniref:Fe/B12 periplasmic-binding domain-containing protein n=1 Tax=Chryseobacterium arthrosphaerae TaxID=651561 RepID=A0A3S0VIW6_9FLAO|nr:hypothetical protein EJ377_00985 [Chryseobacterium arthrosphaerae]
MEKIISMKPDAVFTNYIASFDNAYQLLKNNGIQVVFWMNIWNSSHYKRQRISSFWRIFGKEKEAEANTWK